MALIDFPNVPQVPGVPVLVRSATLPTADSLLSSAISYVAAAIFGASTWGVYDESGNAVLVPDTFLGVDFKNNARVSDYPLEQGAFETYNKVQTPYDCRIRVAIGGDENSRAAFLAECETMLKNTDLYSVVTPEKTYLDATLQNYNYRREQKNGATLLTVELWFLEIRGQEAVQEETPADPSAYPIESTGQVQTQPYRTAPLAIAGDGSTATWSEWSVL